MRHITLIIAVLALAIAAPAIADKGGTHHGGGSSGNGGGNGGAGSTQSDPSCTVAPNPATLGQSVVVSASGLPTADSVWSLTYPPSGDPTVSQVYVNADGSWSGTSYVNQSGRWTYVFSGLLLSNKYGTVASCTEQVN